MVVDSEGPDDDPGTEDDNLRLLPNSPCINSGNPSLDPLPGETDFDGHAREKCGRVDIGTHEGGLGDYDCDRSVTLSDFATWQACMTGLNGGPYDAGCEACDFKAAGTIDLTDFAGFQTALTGPPQRPWISP